MTLATGTILKVPPPPTGYVGGGEGGKQGRADAWRLSLVGLGRTPSEAPVLEEPSVTEPRGLRMNPNWAPRGDSWGQPPASARPCHGSTGGPATVGTPSRNLVWFKTHWPWIMCVAGNGEISPVGILTHFTGYLLACVHTTLFLYFCSFFLGGGAVPKNKK